MGPGCGNLQFGKLISTPGSLQRRILGLRPAWALQGDTVHMLPAMVRAPSSIPNTTKQGKSCKKYAQEMKLSHRFKAKEIKIGNKEMGVLGPCC